jgi:MFS family permease
VFLLYGVLILLIRVFGARIPDAFGARRSATAALALAASGIAIAAAWASVAGLLLGTAVLAGGMSLMYPALLLLAMDGVADSERGSVVGTFSSFFDLATGLGSLLAGAVAALSGNRGAFAAGAVCAAFGLVVLRARTQPADRAIGA